MIKIDSIDIKNFRQFQSVNLRFDEPNGVYFFTGKNGMGKSNFMNAICWCLYGVTPFKSDNIRAGEEKIVNELAAASGDNNVEVSITATIEGTRYRIMRKSTSSLMLNPYVKHQGELRVYEMNSGNGVPQEHPELVIADLLPQSLSRLFIFDGEVIRKLFAENYNLELRENIYKVSNVDILQRADRDIQKAIRVLEKERTANSDDATLKKRLEQAIDDDTKELENVVRRKSELEQKLAEIDAQQDILNEELLAYRETEERAREKMQLEKDIRLDAESIKDYQKKLNEHIVKILPFALVAKQITSYRDEVDAAASKKQIPPAISPSILNQIMTDGRCICGNHIDEAARGIIETMRNDSEKKDELSYLTQHSILCTAKLSILKDEAQSTLDDIEDDIDRLSDHYENLQTRLHIIEEELRKSDAFSSSVENPQVRSDGLKKQSNYAREELGVLKLRETDLLASIEMKREQINDFISATSQNEVIRDKAALLTKSQRAISVIEGKIIQETREKVETGIIETFKLLHWKPEFKKVELDNDFHLNVIRDDHSIRKLGDLSVGERKMLGISIINALSSKLENFDFPFFIDSPTEELDGSVVPRVLDNLKALGRDKQVFVMTLNKPEITEFLGAVPSNRKYHLIREDESLEITDIVRVN